MGENHLPREQPHSEAEKQRRAASRGGEEDAAVSLTSITLMNKNLHNRREAAPDEETPVEDSGLARLPAIEILE